MAWGYEDVRRTGTNHAGQVLSRPLSLLSQVQPGQNELARHCSACMHVKTAESHLAQLQSPNTLCQPDPDHT